MASDFREACVSVLSSYDSWGRRTALEWLMDTPPPRPERWPRTATMLKATTKDGFNWGGISSKNKKWDYLAKTTFIQSLDHYYRRHGKLSGPQLFWLREYYYYGWICRNHYQGPELETLIQENFDYK